MPKKPNILMIMCDQYRGDCFSYKGHPDVMTPNLDTLAQEGTSFDNMYSATPSCVPARATLFTGKKGAKTGFVGYVDGIAWNYDNTLAELLGQEGYQTECIGKMHVHPSRNRMGFDHVTLHDGYLGYYRNHNLPYCENQEVTDDYLYFLKETLGGSADVTQTGIDPNAWIVNPWPHDERLHPTNWVTDQSLRFLASRDRQVPFFLMASYVRPHQPFDAPEKYFRMYEDKTMRPPFVGDWEEDALTIENQYKKDSVFGTLDYETQQRAMKGYYASISHVDNQIGRLVMGLQTDGSYEDTIILFLADHGELLFDHNTYRKVFPYQGSVQIPLIVRVGRNIAQTRKAQSETLASLEDILPTLVDMAGGTIPADVDGHSLRNEIYQEDSQDCPYNNHSYIHGEHAFGYGLSNQFIVTAKDKYIWYAEKNEEQYFDLVEDPHELHNLLPTADSDIKARVSYLRQLLIEELEGRPEGFVKNAQLSPVKSPPDYISPQQR